jgi:hypothetical protein
MKADRRRLLIRFGIELLIYAVLVSIYLLVVMRTLGDFLAELSNAHRVLYAVVGLGLIVAQGLVLELITTFLLERLGLE